MRAVCPACGREFEKTRYDRVYCSQECFHEHDADDRIGNWGRRSAALGLRVREIVIETGKRYGFDPKLDGR